MFKGGKYINVPKIKIDGKTISCRKGENLRKVLIKNGITPHNGSSDWLNCRGLGTCGTCSVYIQDDVQKMNSKEKIRLNTPPFCNTDKRLRLSCQYTIEGDIEIEKGKGFWGERWSTSKSK